MATIDSVTKYLRGITPELSADWITDAAVDILAFCENMPREDAMAVLTACVAAYPVRASDTINESGRLLLADVELPQHHKTITSPSGFKAIYIQVPPLANRLDAIVGKANWSMTSEIIDHMVCVTIEIITPSGYVKRASGVSGVMLAPLPTLTDFIQMIGDPNILQSGGDAKVYSRAANDLAKSYGILMKAMNEHNQNAIKEAETDAARRAFGTLGIGGYLWDKAWHDRQKKNETT